MARRRAGAAQSDLQSQQDDSALQADLLLCGRPEHGGGRLFEDGLQADGQWQDL